MATPVLWAASQGHHYVVDLLLRHGADPMAKDSLSYGLMHVAVFSNNVHLLVLLLYQPLMVDCTDAAGQTPLMCAAYRGNTSFLGILLHWGANVKAVDNRGLTALHWALIGCSSHCVSILLDFGADQFAQTRDGKTPAMVAQEANMLAQWELCIGKRGYAPDGRLHPWPKGMPAIVRNQRMVRWISFLWPFPFLALALWCATKLSIYVSVPMITACNFSVFIATRLAKAAAYIKISHTVSFSESTVPSYVQI